MFEALARVKLKIASSTALSEITRGAGKGAVVQGASVALSFLVAVLAARALGVEAYGYYMYALAWVSVLVLLAKAGLDTVAIKYVAAYMRREEWSSVRGLAWRALQGALALSLGVAACASLVAVEFGHHAASFDRQTVLVGFLLIPLFALLRVTQGLMRGYRSVVRAGAPENVVRPTILLMALGGALALGVVFSSVELAGLHILAAAVAVLVAMYWLRARTPQEVKFARPHFDTRAWYLGALPFALISGMSFLLKQSDILIVGVLCEPSQLAVYVAASRVSQLAAFGLLAVNSIYAPLSSAASAGNDPIALKAITTHATRLIFGATLPIFALVVVFSEEVLALFGDEYRSGSVILIVLAVGQLVNAVTGPVGLLLGMTGFERRVAVVDVFSVVLNVILNVWLIMWIGVIGAAIATAVAMSLRNTILVLIARRRLGITPTIFG